MLYNSTLDTINFVGLPQYLRIIVRAAIKTMHFYKAQTNIFEYNFYLHFGSPNEQFVTDEHLSWVNCMPRYYITLKISAALLHTLQRQHAHFTSGLKHVRRTDYAFYILGNK